MSTGRTPGGWRARGSARSPPPPRRRGTSPSSGAAVRFSEAPPPAPHGCAVAVAPATAERTQDTSLGCSSSSTLRRAARRRRRRRRRRHARRRRRQRRRRHARRRTRSAVSPSPRPSRALPEACRGSTRPAGRGTLPWRRRSLTRCGGAGSRWCCRAAWGTGRRCAYLRKTLGDKFVPVGCPPDGFGDAFTRTASGEQVFVKPHEAEMPFSAFVDLIETPLQPATRGGGGADGRSGGADGRSGGAEGDSGGEEGGSDGSWRGGGGGGAGGGGCGATGDRRAGRPVVYASHQNSSLRTEFEPLWRDVDLSLAWADAAFGAPPAATNFWMGEDAARTTVHADLFDNLYVVVRGRKRFALLPPQEGLLLPPQEGRALRRRPYPAATYREGAAEGTATDRTAAAAGRGVLRAELDEPTSEEMWSAVDLEDEGSAAEVRPLRVEVSAGELLYLPALWWHAVSQRADGPRESTIAVNYWYEPQGSSET
ncbi:hypothetical protein EMIHUDRAFT_435104 [Emiliania huxleyi CCMP1516]|uniref:JmjC domain-containing protein n=2 Tax=Emiliania huxleyi TaxID=2903 RepID=A0A0D3JSS7_EMIH1|nr:hypothetical protein EMIHUDRAFT_435104 [Emiliania huxleyi CCMP1516]EOD26562.1 hypothetical protein EMIHUDRAFT_435104 [Emiliania huxleyi CCMP1516]|eukprot:XP_005778991.1 hypothetical protein EMIHUDRAFT_435104 [Emiliania huxleyi CCMP1516]